MGRNRSVSPVRADGSPRRRSPSRRERSPARKRISNADRVSSRNRSPKRGRSRSPAVRSPVREKPSRTKSPKHRKSPSCSPVRQKPSSRARSPKHEKSRSPPPISPLSKILKSSKAEPDFEKGSGREHDKNHGRKSDRSIREEKDSDRYLPNERKDRMMGRDGADGGSRSRRERSHSPSDRNHRGQRRSRSPRASNHRGHDELTSSRVTEERNGDNESLAKMKAVEENLEAKEKQKPSFELSGKLAAETNRVRGVTLLFNEPPDARKPDIRWRLYVFKAGEVLNEPLYVHRQSCYLFGRERRVADIPTDHPSCSKQHAVLQYRQVEQENPDGTMSKRVRPYLMDLGSTNKTHINDEPIEAQRYYELFEKDTIKFGNSSREYVLLHENSAE